MPGPRDLPPRPARLFGVCAWAAALGLLGLPVAGRASVAIITGQAPSWLEPTVVSCGLAGICLTATSFAAIHRRHLPWLLLAAASVGLVVNGYLTMLL